MERSNEGIWAFNTSQAKIDVVVINLHNIIILALIEGLITILGTLVSLLVRLQKLLD